MADWVIPFIITISYTAIAIVLGLKAKGGMDMTKASNWGASGNTMGFLIMFFLVGAGQVSAFTFMGSPGWVVSKGVAALYVLVYLCLMNFTMYLVNPRINELATKHNILTQAEAFGRRYDSKAVRAIGVIVGSIALIAYAEVQVVGCGYVLNIMSGGHIPLWLGELIILIAIFCYLYTSGVRAVGWTNVFQGVLMFLISFAVGGTLIYKFTGTVFWDEAFKTVLNSDNAAALTLPGLANDYGPLMWSTSILVCCVSIWPSFWIMAAGGKDPAETRRSTTLLPIYQLVIIPMVLVGFVCLFAMPDYTGPADKAALTLALDVLPWWMAGILGAGVLAASQSSCEPLFHALAFSWTRDFFGPIFNISEEKQGKIQRLLLLPFMFALVFPLSVWNPAQLVNMLLIGYGFLAQIFPLALGLWMWPRSTKWGAMVGMFAGVAVTAIFTFVWPNFFGMHGGFPGLIVNVALHIIISLMTKPASKETIKIFFKPYIVEKLYVRK